MKIDHDYLKKLLETFEAAPAPIFDISELQAALVASNFMLEGVSDVASDLRPHRGEVHFLTPRTWFQRLTVTCSVS